MFKIMVLKLSVSICFHSFQPQEEASLKQLYHDFWNSGLYFKQVSLRTIAYSWFPLFIDPIYTFDLVHMSLVFHNILVGCHPGFWFRKEVQFPTLAACRLVLGQGTDGPPVSVSVDMWMGKEILWAAVARRHCIAPDEQVSTACQPLPSVYECACECDKCCSVF